MRSIRHQLLIWLLAIVVAGVGLAGWLIYRQALAEANELFDYQLQEIAAALPSEPFSQVFGSRTNGDEGIVIQIWNRNGVLMYFSHPRAPIAPRAARLSTERTDRGEWRVYGAIVGDNVVQLAQLSVRNRLAANVALRTLAADRAVAVPRRGRVGDRRTRAARPRDARGRGAPAGSARSAAR